ncbi:glycosyl transferase family 1 [Bradyrhizobium forestalis]|uniref:Glycosyl transferase family 1 n=1 Tax=Bradyrhizobium forestalis TaxID=1419263 RepID=A0A2M8RCU2_9BRAD|nr:glycosyltransferase [Bradyrhizobium forestalis]PJG55633.1 glycosyl transferase family 1 [Bradyrhizobium forestalis]
MSSLHSIAFVWDNFGPMHVDRVDAVAAHFAGKRKVVGIEICSESDVYEWLSETGSKFRKITLFPQKQLGTIGTVERARKIVSACIKEKSTDIFLCHYDHPATFLAAVCLRALGRRVYAMGCSKFDDYQRTLWREVAKSFFYLPYGGGISSGKRARDYMRFLGIPERKISTEYNTLSIDRIRKLSGLEPAPGGIPFDQRHFTLVARFVPKKNIATALEAYALYRGTSEFPRDLHLCGSGPLENELKAQAERLQISPYVTFHGFLQTDGVAKLLGSTLALLLPSIEEQFGNVVIEAQAMGVPVILSDNCGARDNLVRSGVNGFVVEPDNPIGIAYFMGQVANNEPLYRRFATAATSTAALADSDQFAAGIAAITNCPPESGK